MARLLEAFDPLGHAIVPAVHRTHLGHQAVRRGVEAIEPGHDHGMSSLSPATSQAPDLIGDGGSSATTHPSEQRTSAMAARQSVAELSIVHRADRATRAGRTRASVVSPPVDPLEGAGLRRAVCPRLHCQRMDSRLMRHGEVDRDAAYGGPGEFSGRRGICPLCAS